MKFTARNVFAYLYATALILSGANRRTRNKIASGPQILSIYFHDPSKQLFSSCIAWLKSKGFHFISLAMLEEIMDGVLPIPNRAVLVTVDDGWKGNIENIVSVANNHSLPVSIFIATAPVEDGGGYWWSYVKLAHNRGIISADVEQVKQMPNQHRIQLLQSLKKTISIERQAVSLDELVDLDTSTHITLGAHTHSHPILTTCSDTESSNEISLSKDKLYGWLGHETPYFAYPNGDYGKRELMLMKELGVRLAFSTVPGYIDRSCYGSRYALPRLEVLSDVSFSENICRMTGLWFNLDTINA